MTINTNHSVISNNKPKVAISLPVYNVSQYLAECLDSILNQTYKNFVVFAVNDGSTDNSEQILNEYAQKDSRIVIINKVNGGLSSARNAALDAISLDGTFDYIAFIDSDDTVADTFIETFITSVIANDADYCVCGVETYNKAETLKAGKENHSVIPLDYISAIKHYCHVDEWTTFPDNLCMTTRLFKTNLIGTTRFNESLFISEDQDFILRVLLNMKRGVLIPDILYFYRQRASSLSHSKEASTIESSFLLAKAFLTNKSINFPAEVRKGLELRACDCWWQEARRVYTFGTLAERKKVKEFLSFIQEHCDLEKLPKKYKKRFFIFSCGDFIISCYFKLFEKKKKHSLLFD